jgi:hypothetical protein
MKRAKIQQRELSEIYEKNPQCEQPKPASLNSAVPLHLI